MRQQGPAGPSAAAASSNPVGVRSETVVGADMASAAAASLNPAGVRSEAAAGAGEAERGSGQVPPHQCQRRKSRPPPPHPASGGGGSGGQVRRQACARGGCRRLMQQLYPSMGLVGPWTGSPGLSMDFFSFFCFDLLRRAPNRLGKYVI